LRRAVCDRAVCDAPFATAPFATRRCGLRRSGCAPFGLCAVRAVTQRQPFIGDRTRSTIVADVPATKP
jgi:hypothetical protein